MVLAGSPGPGEGAPREHSLCCNPLEIPSLLWREVLICDGQGRGRRGKRSCTSYLASSTAGFLCSEEFTSLENIYILLFVTPFYASGHYCTY